MTSYVSFYLWYFLGYTETNTELETENNLLKINNLTEKINNLEEIVEDFINEKKSNFKNKKKRISANQKRITDKIRSDKLDKRQFHRLYSNQVLDLNDDFEIIE